MDLGLEGKTALVTAASKGLGLACARALYAEGADVAICSRNWDNLQAAVEAIRSGAGSGRVVVMQADLNEADDCQRVVQEAFEQLGGLHVLVTNNGGPPAGDLFDFDDADWFSAIDRTLMSAVRLMRAAIPIMEKHKWGRIVNIVSLSVKQPMDDLILSNVLRTGVVSAAKSLVPQAGRQGITINNVLPGYFLTDRVRSLAQRQAGERNVPVDQVIQEMGAEVPRGSIGDPDEMGALVAFLASERAAYINGASILIEGGTYKGLM